MGNLGGISAKTQIRMVDGSSLNPFENENKDYDVTLKNLKKNMKEFEDKIWRNTSIHSVIPTFTMNESINK